jgi:hypothetical protein
MKLTGENRSTRGKTCPSATLSTTNPTWADPGSNPFLRRERPATNRLSHGTAFTSLTCLICAKNVVQNCVRRARSSGNVSAPLVVGCRCNWSWWSTSRTRGWQSQLPCDIAWASSCLAFRGCSYGTFIDWCPYSPWVIAFRSAICDPFPFSRRRVPDVETQSLCDVHQSNVTHISAQQCQLDYYGHRVLRAYRSIRRVFIAWQFDQNLFLLCTVCLEYS